MNVLYTIVGVYIFAVFAFWYGRMLILPYFIKNYIRSRKMSPRCRMAEKFFHEVYDKTNPKKVSINERKRLNIQDATFTYGEMPFTTLADIFQLIDIKDNARFYDLGSGGGAVVLAAALLYPFKEVSGIELIPALTRFSQKRLDHLENIPDLRKKLPDFTPKINIIQGNILDEDFSGADVIFVNATCFTGNLWDGIVEKLSNIQIGSYVILTTKKLPQEHFALIDSRQRPLSWGMNSVHVYRRN